MNKLEKFYDMLENTGRGITVQNGDYGYFVTVAELLENNGKNEFFRKTKGGKVSRNVYCGLEYDRSEKVYYADCYNDCCYHSGPLKKTAVVFIGFTY